MRNLRRVERLLRAAHQSLPISRRAVWSLGAAGTAAYFALAAWLSYSWVDPVPVGRVVIPIPKLGERHGHAMVVYGDIPDLPTDDEGSGGSPLVIYEDSVRLGPAHSTFTEIQTGGMGRFGHWKNSFAFSTSDNSNPATNGRRYWAVLP